MPHGWFITKCLVAALMIHSRIGLEIMKIKDINLDVRNVEGLKACWRWKVRNEYDQDTLHIL